ncbi:hypothetical protein JKF63_00822 [Porcisia hertigi]|uniref:UBX domain-containing protein 11 n=1 Tax=Porcisia hertigi TaxID=2761500 RepID=A0A836L1E3_9TRYP|nr:hypothetical protein JKF63_00822 [Porcisia hertigi]
MDNIRQSASKQPGSPQRFRAKPSKNGIGLEDPLLLSPNVLDDATRRELLQDVLRPSRAHQPLVDRTLSPGFVAQDAHVEKEHFARQLRTRVRNGSNTNSDDLVTAMAARLKDLESKHKVYQAELQEMHAKYRQLNDKYQRERELREETETAVLTLYDEKELLQAQLREIKAASSRATSSHPPSPRSHAKDATLSSQAPPSTPSHPTKVNLFDGDFKDDLMDDGGAKAPGKGGRVHLATTRRPDTLPFSNQKGGGPSSNCDAVSTVAKSPSQPPGRRDLPSPVDVELLIKNARILSDYVGWKGVVKEGNQAGIRERDVVRVVIYKNGICVNQGPFRPYGWALCDAFLDDLTEGFYPYEFKEKYPEGFPIEVVDQTSEVCGEHHGGAASAANKESSFPKEGGRRLGRAPQNAGNIPGRVHTLDEQKKNIGYTTVSAEEFLKKIPERTVTTSGQLVAVRDSMAAFMGVVPNGASSPSAPQTSATVKHVSATEAAYRRRVAQQQQHASPENSAHLAASPMIVGNLIAVLIRLPSGQKITLHMAPEDTVASLRKEFVAAAPSFQTLRYELYQAFPQKQEWNEHQRTIASLGVEKSCTLMVKLIK